jgi:hypothetical protein
MVKVINDCPTSSLATPEDKEQALKVPVSPQPMFFPISVRQYTGFGVFQVIRALR